MVGMLVEDGNYSKPNWLIKKNVLKEIFQSQGAIVVGYTNSGFGVKNQIDLFRTKSKKLTVFLH